MAGTLVVGVLAVASQAAFANGPYYVTAGGSSSANCLSWSSACTISRALALEAGSTAGLQIYMKSGVYNGVGNDLINTTDLALGNNGVTVTGGYSGSGSPGPFLGATTLKPPNLGGGAGIIDFSINNDVTIEGLRVNSSGITYVAGQAPVLNNGGIADNLGATGHRVVVKKGSPTIAVELTAGSTALDSVKVLPAYTSVGVLCSGPLTGCTITRSRINGGGKAVTGIFAPRNCESDHWRRCPARPGESGVWEPRGDRPISVGRCQQRRQHH